MRKALWNMGCFVFGAIIVVGVIMPFTQIAGRKIYKYFLKSEMRRK